MIADGNKYFVAKYIDDEFELIYSIEYTDEELKSSSNSRYLFNNKPFFRG